MITISTVEGGLLRVGALAEVEAKVWAWGYGKFNAANFYYADQVNDPEWTYMGSRPAGGGGLRTVKVEYMLPAAAI